MGVLASTGGVLNAYIASRREQEMVMGLQYRRRAGLSRNMWVNIGLRGISVSLRVGRIVLSSTGRAAIRLGRGFSYRSRI